ncbi:MAG: hypothetical protein KDI01_08515 [Halioglobus sp.]|nr:hypothetical protein [Halioglobus sp.]
MNVIAIIRAGCNRFRRRLVPGGPVEQPIEQTQIRDAARSPADVHTRTRSVLAVD